MMFEGNTEPSEEERAKSTVIEGGGNRAPSSLRNLRKRCGCDTIVTVADDGEVQESFLNYMNVYCRQGDIQEAYDCSFSDERLLQMKSSNIVLIPTTNSYWTCDWET